MHAHGFLAQLAVPVGLDGHSGLLPGRPISSGPSVSAIWVPFAFGQGPGQPAQYATVFGDGKKERKKRKKTKTAGMRALEHKAAV